MNHALDQTKHRRPCVGTTQAAAILTAPAAPVTAATGWSLSEDTAVPPQNQTPMKWALFRPLLQYDKPLPHSSAFPAGTS